MVWKHREFLWFWCRGVEEQGFLYFWCRGVEEQEVSVKFDKMSQNPHFTPTYVHNKSFGARITETTRVSWKVIFLLKVDIKTCVCLN